MGTALLQENHPIMRRKRAVRAETQRVTTVSLLILQCHMSIAVFFARSPGTTRLKKVNTLVFANARNDLT